MISFAEARDHDAFGPRLLGRSDGCKSADPWAENGDRVTGADVREIGSPADAGTDGIEHGCLDGSQRVRYRQEHRIGGEVVVFGVTTPQSGRHRGRRQPVQSGRAVVDAAAIQAGRALIARSTRLEALDGDTVADRDPPFLGCVGPDLFDDTDRLVARDDRAGGRQVTGVELVVGSTETARFDPQQPRRFGHLRELESLCRELPQTSENHGLAVAGHDRLPVSADQDRLAINGAAILDAINRSCVLVLGTGVWSPVARQPPWQTLARHRGHDRTSHRDQPKVANRPDSQRQIVPRSSARPVSYADSSSSRPDHVDRHASNSDATAQPNNPTASNATDVRP